MEVGGVVEGHGKGGRHVVCDSFRHIPLQRSVSGVRVECDDAAREPEDGRWLLPIAHCLAEGVEGRYEGRRGLVDAEAGLYAKEVAKGAHFRGPRPPVGRRHEELYGEQQQPQASQVASLPVVHHLVHALHVVGTPHVRGVEEDRTNRFGKSGHGSWAAMHPSLESGQVALQLRRVRIDDALRFAWGGEQKHEEVAHALVYVVRVFVLYGEGVERTEEVPLCRPPAGVFPRVLDAQPMSWGLDELDHVCTVRERRRALVPVHMHKVVVEWEGDVLAEALSRCRPRTWSRGAG